MIIRPYLSRRQLSAAWAAWLALCAVLWGCGGKNQDTPVIPPATSPLSRQLIGFGVVNVSYTHITAEPAEGSASSGYLRRAALVRVLERRMVKTGALTEAWVLVEGGPYRGWLREALVDIYENEGRARTAAESMGR